MGDAALRYVVLLRQPEQLEFHPLAEALARVRSTPVIDAMAVARTCWGILGEHREESSAKTEASGLSAAGFDALALPENLLEDSPAAVPVMKADLEKTVFFAAEDAPHPAAGPALLCAAIIKRGVTQTIKVQQDISLGQKALQVGILMATGIPIRTSRMRKEVDKTVSSSELFGALDIVLTAPARRVRVLSDDFDYSCLGSEKAYDSLGNFRVLVRRLAALWPEAGRNRGLRFILEGKPQREMGYESLADLDRECRWLLTLRTLRT